MNNKIAFDIGNVLCHVNFSKFYFTMSDSRLLKTFDNVQMFLDEHEKLDYLGITNIRQSLLHTLPQLSESETNKIVDIWNSAVTISDQMMNFMDTLRHKNIQIALLSNMGLAHAEYLKNTYPELFNVQVAHLSCDVGSFKPHKLFYQSFLLEHEDFSGCIYLDDLKDNIAIGSKMKFDAIHFDLEELTENQPPSVLKKKLDFISKRLENGY